MNPSAYKKVPGQHGYFRFSFGGAEVGYLGDDHLLLVETNLAQENVRTVYFDEIQAIQIWDHWGSLALHWIFILGLAADAGLLTMWSMGEPVPFLFYFFLILLLLIEIPNLILGPSCRCRMLTPGGWRPLGIWSRWRSAHKGLAVLLPRLEAFQAAKSGVPLAGESAAGEGMAPEVAAPAPLAAAASKPLPAGFLAFSSVLFFASAAYDTSYLWAPDSWSLVLSHDLTYAAWIGCLAALFAGARSGRKGTLIGIAGVVGVGVQYGCGWLTDVMEAVSMSAASHGGVHPAVEGFGNILKHPSSRALYIAQIVAGLMVAGLHGWAAASASRKKP